MFLHIKPLLFIPSPRDIPEVKESISKLKIDKLWVKYCKQEYAYKRARHWFLKSEYTHLIIHPDDMLATQRDLEYLLLSSSDSVMSGWCINTIQDNWQDLKDTNMSYTITWDTPRRKTYESYNFIPVRDIIKLLHEGRSIIKVKFAGFALQCIPRRIIEQIPFSADHDCCVDTCFSLDCDAQGVDQFINLRVRTKHLKRKVDEIQTGKKEPKIIFEKL